MDVLILRSDGGVSRMRARDGIDIAREIEAWEASVAKDGWTMIGYREVTDAELPPRRFRGAWTLPNGIDGPVVVSLNRARALRRTELERQRDKAIERLRDRIEEAEDNGQTTRAVNLKDKRRALRALDLAAALQAVATVAELDTFTPIEFNE
jgi:hypothetical protein